MISSTMDAKSGTVINESVANYESHLDANTTVPTASTMSIGVLYGKRELFDGLNPLDHFPLRRELLTDRVRILCNLITYTQSYGHAGKE